jgi:hypothetical protein
MQFLPNLPPAVSREVHTNLRDALPAPVPDTPESRADREETAMAAVTALHPNDALEALLAAQVIIVDYQAKDCFRTAKLPGLDPKAISECRVRGNALLRLMQSGTRLLQRTQAKAAKAEAEQRHHLHDLPTPAPTTEEPPFEERPEAEQYVIIHPERAKLIRVHRGLPPKCTFGPPTPDIIAAIVTGTGPLFQALDHRPLPAT